MPSIKNIIIIGGLAYAGWYFYGAQLKESIGLGDSILTSKTKKEICALGQGDSVENRRQWQKVHNDSVEWMNAYHQNPSQYPSAFTLAYADETSEKFWADTKLMRKHAGCIL